MIGPYCYSKNLITFVVVIHHLIMARVRQKNQGAYIELYISALKRTNYFPLDQSTNASKLWNMRAYKQFNF